MPITTNKQGQLIVPVGFKETIQSFDSATQSCYIVDVDYIQSLPYQTLVAATEEQKKTIADKAKVILHFKNWKAVDFLMDILAELRDQMFQKESNETEND